MDINCKYCNSSNVILHGVRKLTDGNNKRYLCKTCGKTFSFTSKVKCIKKVYYKASMDEIDYKIFNCLKDDPRMSMVRMASVVGLSDVAVAKRLNRLLVDGYVKLSVELMIEYKSNNKVVIDDFSEYGFVKVNNS